ncbi:hypothetical protein BCR44DRAFT_1435021 [Catenaria anguillulae PL171]|uniref:Uncharacterized protein n=1 Tax=Catenaria anguillulae PL171 TaxID=765915 RepID=A0A1Y2HKG8_9FUNG|nr:hypothetical protein BCR44DRAFT_1435021 [Catenaria anguillulae PL171]
MSDVDARRPVKFTALLEHTLPPSLPPPPVELSAAHVTTALDDAGCFRRRPSTTKPDATVTMLEIDLHADRIGQIEDAGQGDWRTRVLPKICTWVVSAMDLHHAVDCEDGESRPGGGNGVRVRTESSTSHSNLYPYLIRVALQLPSPLNHDLQLTSAWHDPPTFHPSATCFSLRSWSANSRLIFPVVREFFPDPPTETPFLPMCPPSSRNLVIRSWLPPGVIMDPYQIALHSNSRPANWSIYSSARLPDLEHPVESQFATPHLIVAKVHVDAPTNVTPGGGREYALGVDAEVNVGPFLVSCQDYGDGFLMPGMEMDVLGVSNVIGVKVPRALRRIGSGWLGDEWSGCGRVVAVVVAVWVWGPGSAVGAGETREKVE